jgi:hypothetical protein
MISLLSSRHYVQALTRLSTALAITRKVRMIALERVEYKKIIALVLAFSGLACHTAI